MKILSEDNIIRESRKHAKLALVALWTRLLTLEHYDRSGVLLTKDVPHREREILLELHGADRDRFVDHIIGDYQNRFDLLVLDEDSHSRERVIYDRALHAWRALGTTVLCNTKLRNSVIEFDEDLLVQGIAFKRWFFHSCFSHSFVTEGGQVIWPGVDTTITLIKKLGAWITYYGAFSSETEKPPSIDALPGACSHNQRLDWFGGTLSEFREPWLLKPTLVNVHALSTMSGFGRALPPASAAIARAAAESTFTTLTTEVKTDPYWVDLFRVAAERVCRRMSRSPVVTHCSINASACFERTTEEGGTASYVVEGVNKLLRMSFDDMFARCNLPEEGYDPFGRRVYDKSVHWTLRQRMFNKNIGKPVRLFEVDYNLPALGYSRPQVFGWLAYRGAFLDPRVNSGRQWDLPNKCPYGGFPYNREIFDLLKDSSAPFYNETLGDIVTLWAFNESLQYGHFEDLSGGVLTPIVPDLAIFAEPGFKVYVQDRPIPASFMALEEPGWKARCLTKNKAFVVILQALLRHPIAESVGSDGRVGLGLKSSYIMWDFLKLVRGKQFGKNWYCISTDLKQATDLLPHDLLDAIWQVALPQFGINRRHPLFVLKNMIMIDHNLIMKFPGEMPRSAPHRCGSFMGEPVSFMGLSLYNLCVSEIAGYFGLYRLDLEIKYNLSGFQNSGPLPTGYICIVGDDRFELTDVAGIFPIVNTIYRKTNGKPSPGKNTVSRFHGILAENHIFLDRTGVQYLDTIKAKLLTPSTRFHSDNQSSILGKGSTLYQQLNWLEETCPVADSAAVRNSRMIYTTMMLSGFFPRDMKRALSLPVTLPSSLGGFNFPASFSTSKQLFAKELNILWWLVTAAPIEVFFEYATGIRDITSSKRRGLRSDPLSILWRENISDLVREQGLVNNESFEPLDKTGLYSLKSVLEYVHGRFPIPISSVTGQPQVNLTVDFVYKQFGYLPIESLIDLWERQSTFTKAFKEGVNKKEKLSFHKYVNNLHRFWDNTQEVLSHVNFSEHEFKSMDDVHWKFSQRLRTFIHRDCCGGGRLSSAATLFVKLLRVDGVVHTEQGWSDISDRAVAAYVQRIRAEREEPSQE